MFKTRLQLTNFTLCPVTTLKQLVKQKAKWAAVEGDENASITTQLEKPKAEWAAIKDGDHNTSITTHVKKKTTTESNAGTTKLQRATKSKNTRTTTLERSVE